MDKDMISLVKAAMIMLNTYGDLMGSAAIFEDAMEKYGKKEVENLILELGSQKKSKDKEINLARAELLLSELSGIKHLNWEMKENGN